MCLTLIVEDNAIFRRSLKEILRARFPTMAIEEAVDGKEALQKVQLLIPDLIFMDIKLPGENGLDVTREIKSQDQSKVVIVLTSYDLPEYREAAYESGANYFLTKGLATGEEIMNLVESIIASAGGQQHQAIA